jgi:hypothetical protein
VEEDFAADGCFAWIGSLLMDGGGWARQVGSDRLSIALGTANLMRGQAGRRNYE